MTAAAPASTANPPTSTAVTRSVRSHRARWIGGAVALVIALLIGGRLLVGPSVPIETVVEQPFVQTLVATGRVEAPHRVAIGVQVTGRVARVPVVDGQHVLAGAILVELESSELRAARHQAGLAVAEAAARLRQVREVQAPVAEQAVREARLAHDAAYDARQRSAALFAAGAIAQVALDDAIRAEETSAARLAAAEHQLATARPTGSDLAAAAAAVAVAQAGVELAKARLGYATVVAPHEGTLISRDVEVGDIVTPGTVLMTLSPAGATDLVVQVDEQNMRLLRVGQSALASADAYPTERFAAVLSYINPGVDAERGAVEARLRVTDPPAYLRQDMTVSVDVELARRTRAVLVPVDALHEAPGVAPWVLRVDGAHARRRAVTLGLRSDALAEVLVGLAAGDRVVPVTQSGIIDGSRVRPTRSSPR